MAPNQMYQHVDASFLEGFRRVRRPGEMIALDEADRQREARHFHRAAVAAELFRDLSQGRLPAYFLQEVLAPSRPEMARLIESNYPGVLRRAAPWESPSIGLLQEEMSTSDFPLLMADVMNQMLLAEFAEAPGAWRQYIAVGQAMPDFRTAHLLSTDGGDGRWGKVPEEGGVAYTTMTESEVTITPDLWGLGMKASWRLLRNDRLGALRRIPGTLARGGRRTIAYEAVSLLFDSSGPDATVVSSGNGNLISGNPAFSITSLATALEQLASFTDSNGEPISVTAPRLVHGPGLMVEVNNVMNQLSIDMTVQGGDTNQTLRVNNWIRQGIVPVMDPTIPIRCISNGATTWALVADPGASRPAAEIRFLAGFDAPQLFQKTPNTIGVGGSADPMLGDFDTMTSEYKGLVAFGGVAVEPKSIVGSDGTG